MKTGHLETTNINEVAKSIGMNPLTCPHCAKKIPMGEMIGALFMRIIEEAQAGKRVIVHGFGLFFTTLIKGHSIDTAATNGRAVFQDITLLRFRQSSSTREVLNPDRKRRKEEAKAKAAAAAAKKGARR